MSNRITVIGGITAEIEGNPYGKLELGVENPTKISISHGGTGRNIAENLARLGAEVRFVSATGDDFPGRSAVDLLDKLGVDVEDVEFLEEENTAASIRLLNILGDVENDLFNDDVFNRISKELLAKATDRSKDSKIIAMDGNITDEALRYAVEKLEGLPLFFDPVSQVRAARAKDLIGKFHTIKPNRAEAEALCGKSILNERELMEAGDWFCGQGVKRVFISLAGGGVYYKEGANEGILRPGAVSVIGEAGAGDAFSAAALYCHVKGMDVEETAHFGMAAAAVALEAKAAVNPRMSLKAVEEKRDIKE